MVAGKAPRGKLFRVGGMVVDGSVAPGDGLTVKFDLTDNERQVTVRYKGILPDLFREVRASSPTANSTPDGDFVAEEVLAKHDENYMPPEVAGLKCATAARRQRPLRTMIPEIGQFVALIIALRSRITQGMIRCRWPALRRSGVHALDGDRGAGGAGAAAVCRDRLCLR